MPLTEAEIESIMKKAVAGRPLTEPRPPGFGEQAARSAASLFDSMGVRAGAASGSEGSLRVLGQREGVPFDIQSGAPLKQRGLLNIAANRQEQASILRAIPGVQDVRFNRLGEPVITVMDAQTKAPKDVLVNPLGMDTGDLMTLITSSPEMVAGMLAARGVPAGAGTMKALRAIAQMAIAGQAAGAGMEAIVRDNTPELGLDMPDLLERRGKMALVDAAFGVGFGVAGKVTAVGRSPFANRGPLQFDADAGQEWLKDRFGITLDMTPAEKTGSIFLGRSEALAAEKPGSSIPMERIFESRRKQVSEIQRISQGTSPDQVIPGDTEVGRRALDFLGGKLAPLDFAIGRETQAVLKAAEADIEHSLARATRVPAPVRESALGQRLFNRADQKWTDFQAISEINYSPVKNDPRVLGRTIDATDLAEDAQQILDDIPAVEKQVVDEIEGGFGSLTMFPATETRTELKRFTQFVDKDTLTKLQQLADTKGGQIGYNDLIELRRDLDDSIARGSVLASIPERRLLDIRGALTARIEGGLKELDSSGALLKKWQKANSEYASGIKRFTDIDIKDIFKDPERRGALGLNQIVDRAVTDPDMYRAYKEFYGPASVEFSMVRRVVADRIVGNIPGSSTVDAADFVTRLRSLYRNRPEIAKDVFGSEGSRLLGFGEAARQARQKTVDVDELVGLLERGTPTSEALERLVSAQSIRDTEIRNQIFARVRAGNVGRESILPSKFVDSVVFKADPLDLAGVMATIGENPALLTEIRQRTRMTIFDNATEGIPGRETVTASGLLNYLDDNVMVERLTTVLGADGVKDLQALAGVLRPGDLRAAKFARAGSFAVSQQVADIQRAVMKDVSSAFGEVDKVFRSFILSAIYTTKPVREHITSIAAQDRGAYVNAFIASQPFAEMMVDTFGPEYARIIALQGKESLDGFTRRLADGLDTGASDGGEAPSVGLSPEEIQRMIEQTGAAQPQPANP